MVPRRQEAESTPDTANEVPEVTPEYRREQLAEQRAANLPARVTRVISPSELHQVDSMEAAIALLQNTIGVSVVEAREEIGDGFDYLENKDGLVGRPLLFMQWECGLSPSYTDRDGKPLRTVQAWLIVERAGEIRKFRISDFSTGICAQLWDYTERTGRTAGLAAPKGLRKSEFPYVDPDTGAKSVAATYYIDLSKDL